MKKTLYTLLTATTLMSAPFAATALTNDLTTTAPTRLDILLATPEHKATSVLARFACHSDGNGITIQEVKDAINQGGAFLGNANFWSILHTSAENHPLNLFQPFFEACMAKNPNSVNALSTNELSLLHFAAANNDPAVATFLISQGLKTDLEGVLYHKEGFAKIIHPLFYAIANNNDVLIQLLSEGLTTDQIQSTRANVEKHRTFLKTRSETN